MDRKFEFCSFAKSPRWIRNGLSVAEYAIKIFYDGKIEFLKSMKVVASYPFDDNEHFTTFTSHSYSKSPDDDFFKYLAQTYSNNHAFMFKMDGKACGDTEPTFHKGKLYVA